jgi:hypothetical protein
MSKKRDAEYYKARLRREYPTIYADLRAGKINSVRRAAAKAGLIHLPGRLDGLKRGWKLSSPKERSEFLQWIKSSGIGLKKRAAAASIADATGKLTPQAIAFITDWVKKNRASAGRIMGQCGYSNYDYRLAQSLNGKVGLPADVLAALKPWLQKQGFR